MQDKFSSLVNQLTLSTKTCLTLHRELAEIKAVVGGHQSGEYMRVASKYEGRDVPQELKQATARRTETIEDILALASDLSIVIPLPYQPAFATWQASAKTPDCNKRFIKDLQIAYIKALNTAPKPTPKA